MSQKDELAIFRLWVTWHPKSIIYDTTDENDDDLDGKEEEDGAVGEGGGAGSGHGSVATHKVFVHYCCCHTRYCQHHCSFLSLSSITNLIILITGINRVFLFQGQLLEFIIPAPPPFPNTVLLARRIFLLLQNKAF